MTELGSRGWAVASLDLQPAASADHSVQVDVTDADAMAEAVREVEDRLGPVAAAVNVAGYYEMLPISGIHGRPVAAHAPRWRATGPSSPLPATAVGGGAGTRTTQPPRARSWA